MHKRINHVKVGEPITDEVWNEVVDALNRAKSLTVAQGSGLTLHESPTGRILTIDRAKDIPARLVGSSSPYSWVALMDGPGGTYVDRTAGLTGGTSDAYEVNGKSGLDGKIVMLSYTEAGDWRFQYVGYGPPPPCDSGRLCLTVTNNGCASNGPVHNAEVTWTDSNGDVVGTCKTNGASPSSCCVDLPVAGTYNVSVKATGATPRTSSVNAICDQDNTATVSFPSNSLGMLCFALTNCGTGVSGVDVTVSKSGEPTASGTTDGSGNACISLGAGGGYTYSATYGNATASGSVTIFGCGTVNRSLAVVTDYYFRITANSDARNNGCSGTFTLYRGSSNTDPVIFSQSVTLSTFDGTGWTSPVYHQSFSAIQEGTTMFAELAFPSGVGGSVFSLGCSGPTTPDNWGSYTGVLCP